MTAAASSSRAKETAGPIRSLIALPFVLAMWLLGGLLLSVIVEWIGLVFFWPELGTSHSYQMMVTELGYLNEDFRHSILTQLPWIEAATPAQFAAHVAQWFNHYVVQPLNLQSIARSNVGHWMSTFAQATINIIQLYGIRVAILVLATPLFAVAGLWAGIEGLIRRDLRKFGGGHESAYVFHHAKRLVKPALYAPAILYLAWPNSIHPSWIFLPFAALFAVAIITMATTFKKYL